MMLGARTAAWAKSGYVPKYIGLDESFNTPFSCGEFSSGDFEFVVTAKTAASWTYNNYRFLITNGSTGSAFSAPIGMGLLDGGFLIRIWNGSENIIATSNRTLIEFGLKQRFRVKKVGSVYAVSITNNGEWTDVITNTSTSLIADVPIRIGHGNNAGWDWHVGGGEYMLDESYLTAAGKLLWEGELGAYKRVNG